MVHRECNTGLPLNQLFEMGDEDNVEFTSTLLEADEEFFHCTITATEVANYTAWYSDGGDFDLIPCGWTGQDLDILDWTADCDIRMVPNPATLTVSKVWDVSDDQATTIDYTTVIWVSAEWSVLDHPKNTGDDTGDLGLDVIDCPFDEGLACIKLKFKTKTPASQDVYLDIGDYGGEDVYLREKQSQSSVEVGNTCRYNANSKRGRIVDITAAEEVSCEFTNTVFFEGIPTLSQYGLAIMALLMLGVGFVGFRRFV